jgi:tRNA-binding EMAP/Myf-like protein
MLSAFFLFSPLLKTLAGVRSEAMLLAVETDDGFSLLQPDKPVKPGSKIK